MKRLMARGIGVVLVVTLLLGGCATPYGAPDGRLAAETFGRGLVNPAASRHDRRRDRPGLAFPPYTLATGLEPTER
jgi:hypothetical protein